MKVVEAEVNVLPGTGLIMVAGPWLTTSVKVVSPLKPLLVSVAVTATLVNTPVSVGVPESVPPLDIVNPVGRPVADHVYVELGLAVNGPTL
jgi:hypothetical protein